MNENLQKYLNLVNPEILKSNLTSCSLYIVFFETTKDFIVDQPKSFFSVGYSSDEADLVSPDYKAKVLAKDKTNAVNASLLWFLEQGAIEQSDIDTYSELRQYRNGLAHEMLAKLFDGLDAAHAERITQLINFRIKLERWWLFNIEIPTGDYDDSHNINEEDTMTSTEILYTIISHVLSDDPEKANYFHSELSKAAKK